jgi:DNA ligase (NAD+)
MDTTLYNKMKTLNMPFVCPSCSGQLQWKSVDLVCNNIHCGEKLVKEVAAFLINCGVEKVTSKSLTNWEIVSFNDLLSFDPDTNSKSQDNFASELKKNVFSKSKEELFANMSFDGAGSTNINKLLEFFGNGELEMATRNLYLNPVTTFREFPEGIGQTIIDKIEKDWKRNLAILNDIIKDRRYAPVVKAVTSSTGNLSGKSFLLTGSMSETRGNIEKLIKENGGTIASNVSKALTFLVCAPDSWGSSSKYTKAVKSGVQVITEDQLRAMI